jgi:4-hydroxybenzoate polyprenyltransferase
MLGLQVSIGALNDVVDSPLDAGVKPGKPIPAGLVSRRTALAVAAAGLTTGLLLSAPSGPPTVLAGAAAAALGYVYDLRLSRTALSWLPLALALPLVPIYAWVGTRGTVPAEIVALVPFAVVAGVALAVANGLVDVERDAGSGRLGIVVRLGRWRAWLLQTGLIGGVALLAALVAPGVPAPAGAGPGEGVSGPTLQTLRAVRLGGMALGMLLLALGSIALAAHRPGVRERGWELEAVGVASMGIGWLAGAAGAADRGAGG